MQLHFIDLALPITIAVAVVALYIMYFSDLIVVIVVGVVVEYEEETLNLTFPVCIRGSLFRVRASTVTPQPRGVRWYVLRHRRTATTCQVIRAYADSVKP